MNIDIRFRFAQHEQVPVELYGRVMAQVGRARTRAARIRIAFASLGIGASLAGSFIAIRATLEAAAASGFTSYASLALTDTSVIALHAQAFAFTLVETLPGVQVAFALFGLSVLLVSMRSLIRSLSQPVRLPEGIRHA